jgi:tetratricopeptide (TPR) repeat protein
MKGSGLAWLLVFVATISGSPDEALAAPGDEVRFQALLEGAAKARDAGDLEKAATLLGQAIEIEAAPEMLHNYAKVLEELGRYKEAVAVYRRGGAWSLGRAR